MATLNLNAGAHILPDQADTVRNSRPKITDTRPNKPAELQKGVGIKVVPFKPIPVKVTNLGSNLKTFPTDKVLNNVKVYPNPVADQLNLTYQVSKEANVTIKIMDVLGNEVVTLLSQRQSAGEKISSFDISSRLNSGFYFIRLIVGNETVVKRISVQ
ncbi:MAG TPA: T9SS type A sorting domain-containing protein [Sphingobacteriaceae bacterium]